MLYSASSPEPRPVRSRASPPPLVALSPPPRVRRTLASDTAGLAEAEQLDLDVLALVVRALWLFSPTAPLAAAVSTLWLAATARARAALTFVDAPAPAVVLRGLSARPALGLTKEEIGSLVDAALELPYIRMFDLVLSALDIRNLLDHHDGTVRRRAPSASQHWHTPTYVCMLCVRRRTAGCATPC